MGYYITKQDYQVKLFTGQVVFIGLMIVQRKKLMSIRQQQTQRLSTPMVKMVDGQVQLLLVSS